MKYKIDLNLSTEVEAESEEAAREAGRDWQENLAGSNDGSEMLANAELTVTAAGQEAAKKKGK